MFKSKSFRVVLLILSLVASSNTFAKMEFVTVPSQGTGTSRADAIKDALQEAVGQVNGAQIAAETSKTVTESYKETNGQEDHKMTEDFKQDIATKTKGVIRKYDVVSEQGPTPELALWQVSLNVTVAKYNLSKQAERLRMAVVPFPLSPTIKDKKRAADFEPSFVNTIVSYLTQTRRFAMLDRQFMEKQQAELKLIQGENFRTEEMARLGNQLGTDYLISGTIDDVNQTSNTITMRTTGKKITTVTTSVNLSYRIFDVATGLIKLAGTYTDPIEDGANVMTMAKNAGDKIGQDILNAIYPITVVSVNGKNLTLGQGGVTVKQGMQYNLIQYGNKIFDPNT
jgi:TolB-like protein